MDPLSMRIANPALPAHAEAPVDAPSAAARAASSVVVGRAVAGCGALANRQIAVGAGEDRARSTSAASVIGALLSKMSTALQAIVLSPRP